MGSPVAIKTEYGKDATSPTTPLDFAIDVKPNRLDTKPDIKARSAAQIMQQQRGNATPGLRTSSSSKRVFPIMSLNPYQGSWLIKVRVTNKSPMRTYTNARGSGNVFKVEFTDEDGTEIEATMWREAADKFHNIFELGKVYYVSRGTLKAANKQYSSVKNDYEMTLSVNSEVEEAGEEEGAIIPVVNYSFVKLHELGPYVGGRKQVDVIGVVKNVTSILTVRRKSNGDEIPKREITLADESMRTVVVTLWDKLALEEGAKLMEMAEEAPVVAIKSVRVGDYQGVSLNTSTRSTMAINPDIAQSASLKTWYEIEGKDGTLVAAGADLPGSGLRSGGKTLYEDRLSIGDLSPTFGEEKVAYFNARLIVSFIKPDQPMYYQACEKCNRKVSEGHSGGFWCEGCGQNHEACKRRYLVSMKTMDSTGEAWISAFNEQAEQILGVTADELSDLREQDDQRYKTVLKRATWGSYAMRVSAEVSEYRNEKRQRLKVRSVAAIDWAAESALLLKMMEQL